MQFRFSHYSEKARWALDWKGVAHRRRNLLPGPHAVTVRKMAPETTVPLVVFDGEAVQGSARIIEELERRHPDPALYPEDPAQRDRALEIQRWFDAEIGPPVRQALFAHLLDEGAYVCRMFAGAHPLPMRLVYRAMFPVAQRMIRKEYRLGDPSVLEAARDKVREGLDFVAKEAGPDGHLVGDRFSVADLGAAALLAPTCNPPDCAMTRPEPWPASVQRWLDDWARHPGTAWVLRTYREHRPKGDGAAQA
ncbi:MAG: glutathione S-transferase [Myxococcota bacterium]|nr:glutathione S-transferase [Myxococcota bacterium]